MCLHDNGCREGRGARGRGLAIEVTDAAADEIVHTPVGCWRRSEGGASVMWIGHRQQSSQRRGRVHAYDILFRWSGSVPSGFGGSLVSTANGTGEAWVRLRKQSRGRGFPIVFPSVSRWWEACLTLVRP